MILILSKDFIIKAAIIIETFHEVLIKPLSIMF
jgi:hypothetical protein